jgi:hypothetical protein
MTRRLIAALLLLAAALPLSGCVVGDGIAQIVKLTNDGLSGSRSSSAPAEAPAPTPAPAPQDLAPPPPPAAAPARSSVNVETLAPPPGH